MRVEQLMNPGDALPVVQPAHRDARRDLRDVAQGLGHDVGDVDKDGRLAGIITDGDLRRKMAVDHAEILDLTAARRDDRQPGRDRRPRWPSKRWH